MTTVYPPASITPEPSLHNEFPYDHSTCESCGYTLRGLTVEHQCPECGRLIAESHPNLRTGLPWQRRSTLLAWLTTTLFICIRPAKAFRVMSVDRYTRSSLGIGRDRTYLAYFYVLILLSCAIILTWTGTPIGQAAKQGMYAGYAMLIMTYIEAAGVAWFSKRKGWPVTWRISERVACYSAVGWLPAMITGLMTIYLWRVGIIASWLTDWQVIGNPYREALAYALGGVMIMGAIMWFEILVWIGARKARYANAEAPP